MGANFCVREYATKDRAEVRRMWTGDVEQSTYDYGHSYSGEIGMLGPDIQWRTEKFKTIDECEKFIMDNHEKWSPAMAVAFDGGWVVGGWCAS